MRFSAMGIMSVLWVIVGYSMSFGESVLGGWCGWNADYLFLSGIDDKIHGPRYSRVCLLNVSG